MRGVGEIHLIPFDAAGGLERHRQTLIRDFEAGVDLGPRGAHIQASGRTLEALVGLLRAQHAVLMATAPATPEILDLSARLQAIAESVEHLARRASAVPI